MMLPLATVAQQLRLTHTAVFFNRSSDSLHQAEILQTNGLKDTRNAVYFPTRNAVFVPVSALNENGVLNDSSVIHMAPVHTTANGHFITYRQNFFVQVNHAEDIRVLESEAKELGVDVVGPYHYQPELIELRTTKRGVSVPDAIEALRGTGLFGTIGPNLMHTVSDCSVNDPRYDRQWHLRNDGSSAQGGGTQGADIEAETAWAITTGNSDVKIAILDSGVDTLHPDLIDKLLPGFDAMGAGTNGYPVPNFDSDGHGTACAGIAAASTDNGEGIAGVCQDCGIIPVRVFEYQDIAGEVQPWSETQVFMDGINWAWQEAEADIASNSWGVPDFLLAFFPGGDSLVNIAIDAAIDQGRGGRGVPMVFSSGNDGVTDTIPIWPARYERTIAVGATSMCDEHKNQTSCDGESWWAGNWGEGLDVSAPGVRVPATDMLGAEGFNSADYYNSFNGTSAACPIAAGILGLVLSEHPLMPVWQLRHVLRRGAEKVGGYDYDTWKEDGLWSYELGYGRVNALNTLNAAAAMSVTENEQESLNLVLKTHPDRFEVVTDRSGTYDWQLWDMNGRLIRHGRTSGTLTLESRNWSSGMYALRIFSENSSETLKLTAP